MRRAGVATGMLGLAAAVRAEPAGPAVPAATTDCVADGGTITVCGRRRAGEERHRLPRARHEGFDPRGSMASVLNERARLLDGDGAGADLTRGSCSAVGASGATGCMVKAWREADRQKGR